MSEVITVPDFSRTFVLSNLTQLALSQEVGVLEYPDFWGSYTEIDFREYMLAHGFVVKYDHKKLGQTTSVAWKRNLTEHCDTACAMRASAWQYSFEKELERLDSCGKYIAAKFKEANGRQLELGCEFALVFGGESYLTRFAVKHLRLMGYVVENDNGINYTVSLPYMYWNTRQA